MINQAELKKQLHYDQDTGVFTRLFANTNSVKIGGIVGCVDAFGYVVIRVFGKLYKAHRLAFLYINGELPVNSIDHINGVKNDNSFANLRTCTQSENGRNTGLYKTNTSGFKGVSWDKASNKWKAQCAVNRKRHQLGYFETAELASLAYQAFASEHHGDFYNNGVAN